MLEVLDIWRILRLVDIGAMPPDALDPLIDDMGDQETSHFPERHRKGLSAHSLPEQSEPPLW